MLLKLSVQLAWKPTEYGWIRIRTVAILSHGMKKRDVRLFSSYGARDKMVIQSVHGINWAWIRPVFDRLSGRELVCERLLSQDNAVWAIKAEVLYICLHLQEQSCFVIFATRDLKRNKVEIAFGIFMIENFKSRQNFSLPLLVRDRLQISLQFVSI